MAARSLTPQELHIWRVFQDMGEEVRGRVGRDILEATGLSGPEFGVLSRLVGFGKGEMRQQALAKVMKWEKSRLSHQLTRMEDRELIKRESADGAVVIGLTKLGHQKLTEALPVRAESVKRHFLSRLTRDQIDTIVLVGNLLSDGR
ncbi:MAG: MarR family transcriptional regulator [Bryobacteraceae bacterium]